MAATSSSKGRINLRSGVQVMRRSIMPKIPAAGPVVLVACRRAGAVQYIYIFLEHRCVDHHQFRQSTQYYA
jgi:hypothetical protein